MSLTVTPAPRTRQAPTTTQASTSQATCTWENHCLGDYCSSFDDCDHDWVCDNGTCRTCCLTQSEAASSTPNSPVTTSSSSSSTSTPEASTGNLKTGAAVGIGVGSVVFLLICAIGLYWMCFRRRKRREAQPVELMSADPASYGAGRPVAVGHPKDLYQARSSIPELPTRHPPVELSTTQLVELDDNSTPRPKGKTSD